MRRPGSSILVPLVLLGLTWAVYSPVRRFGFVDFDDPDVVLHNPHVNGGLTPADARWALTGFAMGHWEPLTWLSLQADASVWRLRAGPMHLENVLLHAAGSAALFGLLASATGAVGRSGVVAALFAVHPMHVESVAWVTERRDVLSTPLLMAALWAYVRYARAGRHRFAWYLGFLGLYGLSLTAKATGMTLPAALLLMDAWPLRRGGWERLRPWGPLVLEKLPVAALATAAAAAAVAAQRAVGAASSLAELGVTDRLTNAIVTTVLYVVKLIVPTGLSVFYPHPGTRPAGAVVAAAALLVIATAGTWRQRVRRPYLLAGWGWFLVTLLPTSGIVQSGPQAMADRYSYVPSIGLLVAAVWAAADAVAVTVVRVGTAMVAVAAYGMVGHRQVWFWRDTETLFNHADAVTDDNAVAAVALGNIALARGDAETAARRFQQAVDEQPGDADARAALGNYCLTRHDPATAAELFGDAVRLRPRVARFHVQRAAALSQLRGRRADAVAECRAALALDPSNADARAGLADLLARPPEDRP
jgi:hypothetical protein